MKVVVAYNPTTRAIERVAISSTGIPDMEGEIDILEVSKPDYWVMLFKSEDDFGAAILDQCIVNESKTDIELEGA